MRANDLDTIDKMALEILSRLMPMNAPDIDGMADEDLAMAVRAAYRLANAIFNMRVEK